MPAVQHRRDDFFGMYGGHQRLQRCLYGRKIFAIQICRADHLRFTLFIYAKHTIKIEKSQSRLQATLHRRAHGLHSLRPHSPAEPMAPFRRAAPDEVFPAHGEGGPHQRWKRSSSHSHFFCLSKSASSCALGMFCVPSTSVRSKTLEPLGGYFDFFWKSVS